MPELCIYETSFGVNDVRNLLPSVDLVFRPDSGSMRPFCPGTRQTGEWWNKSLTGDVLPLWGDEYPLGHDQASTSRSTLLVVLDVDCVGYIGWDGTVTRQCGHEYPVL